MIMKNVSLNCELLNWQHADQVNIAGLETNYLRDTYIDNIHSLSQFLDLDL